MEVEQLAVADLFSGRRGPRYPPVFPYIVY